MRSQFFKPVSLCILCLGSLALACSSTTSPSGGGTGGKSSSNGGSAKGGSATGGSSSATGGSSTASGGSNQTGGVASSGGTTGSGGKSGSGGTTATGGAATTGGSSSGSGGLAALGGATGAGGRIGSGGAVATGGVSAPGGSTGSGGVTSADGGPGSGGRTGRDGSAGGTPGTGGTSTGGSTSNGIDGSTASGMSAGCGKTSTITSSQYNNGNPISITAANMPRRYILNVPTNYDNTKPYKLVVAYHALNSNDHSVYNEKYYDLLPLSNNTTIFVAPNGQVNGAGCTGTGIGESNCGWPNTSDEDMKLADAVVAQVEENFCVDTNHIYATGWSYGASMSEQTACERPLGGTGAWGVRAIAIYAVAYLSNSTNCKASKPVAYYASHGTNDSVLNYSGGVSIAQTWAGVDGCTWATPPQATGSHICTKLTGCTAGYPLEFCSFVGPHTAYPDSGNESSSWGPQEVWTFLSQF